MNGFWRFEPCEQGSNSRTRTTTTATTAQKVASTSFDEMSSSSENKQDDSPPPPPPRPAAAVGTGTTAAGSRQDPYKSVTWSDIDYDDEGGVIGVIGREWRVINAKDVRSVCMALKLSGGLRTTKKEDMINRIIAAAYNRPKYARLIAEEYNSSSSDDDENEGDENRKKKKQKKSKTGTTQKEPQCPFRLVNLLFSDQFANDFGNLGQIADRPTLDSGKAAHGQYFWEKVQKAFVDEDNNILYGDLHYTESDDVFAGLDHIDCCKIVPHTWKKLEKIWKGLHAEYKAAFSRFTRSGNHDSNFFGFCTGRLAVYYLWKKLQERPQLNAFVSAELPEGCNMQSEGGEFISDGSSTVGVSNRKPKQVRQDPTVLATAIKELGSAFQVSNHGKVELQELKKTLFQEQNIREEKKLQLEQRKAHVYEWEKVGHAIDKVFLHLDNVHL